MNGMNSHTAQPGHALRNERIEAPLLTRIAELEVECEAHRNSSVDKILAMSDEQVTALTRLDGHDPEDIATIGKQSFEIATLRVRIAEMEKDAARYQHLRKCLFEDNCPWIDTMESEPKTADEFDAAIDAAMKEQA